MIPGPREHLNGPSPVTACSTEITLPFEQHQAEQTPGITQANNYPNNGLGNNSLTSSIQQGSLIHQETQSHPYTSPGAKRNDASQFTSDYEAELCVPVFNTNVDAAHLMQEFDMVSFPNAAQLMQNFDMGSFGFTNTAQLMQDFDMFFPSSDV